MALNDPAGLEVSEANTREFRRALEILGNPENFRDGEEEFGKIGEFAWQISFSDPIFR